MFPTALIELRQSDRSCRRMKPLAPVNWRARTQPTLSPQRKKKQRWSKTKPYKTLQETVLTQKTNIIPTLSKVVSLTRSWVYQSKVASLTRSWLYQSKVASLTSLYIECSVVPWAYYHLVNKPTIIILSFLVFFKILSLVISWTVFIPES